MMGQVRLRMSMLIVGVLGAMNYDYFNGWILQKRGKSPGAPIWAAARTVQFLSQYGNFVMRQKRLWADWPFITACSWRAFQDAMSFSLGTLKQKRFSVPCLCPRPGA